MRATIRALRGREILDSRGSGRPKNWDARSTRRSSPRGAAAPQAGSGSSARNQAEPLVCERCGGPLKIVAYITDTVAIRRILEHLGLTPPEKPPPEVREILRVPVADGEREIGANPA